MYEEQEMTVAIPQGYNVGQQAEDHGIWGNNKPGTVGTVMGYIRL